MMKTTKVVGIAAAVYFVIAAIYTAIHIPAAIKMTKSLFN